MINWDYAKGLPPLRKSREYKEFELMNHEVLYTTNVDGFPYLLEDLYPQAFTIGNKISIEDEKGYYTVKSVDHIKKHVELKLEKVLDITERRIENVVSHYMGWGMTKEAEKVKCNYLWTYASSFSNVNLNIEGKLSKNQTVQYKNDIVKITELVKCDDGLIQIVGEFINTERVTPIYPYVKNGETICYYDDIEGVWLRQVKDWKINN